MLSNDIHGCFLSANIVQVNVETNDGLCRTVYFFMNIMDCVEVLKINCFSLAGFDYFAYNVIYQSMVAHVHFVDMFFAA